MDGLVTIRVVSTTPPTPPTKGSEMDDKDYAHLKLRMHSSFDASTDRRNIDADLYSGDVRRAYLTNKDRYSQVDAFAFQKASEAGSGRTRIESNTPAATQTVGG